MSTPLFIDLNADLGERPHALLDGSEARLIRMITSANIACGGHAGDASTMTQTLALCAQHGVSLGAHPSFPDRTNFGRNEMPMTAEEITQSVFEQVRDLGRIAAAQRMALHHVKPHGALYNLAARNKRIAEAVARGVVKWRRDLILVGLAHSAIIEVGQAMGLRVVAEAFVDRVYEENGTLRSRTHADALIQSPPAACAQAFRIIKERRVIAHNGAVVPLVAETLCIHSDSPNALAVLTALREKFKEENIAVAAFSKRTN